MTIPAPLFPHIDFSTAELPNYHEVFTALRRQGPVVSVVFGGQPAWAIIDHAEISQAFSDVVHFDPGPSYEVHVGPSQGRTLSVMTGEEHRIHRRMLNPGFLPAKMRTFVEPLIAPTVHESLDVLEGRDEADLMADVCRLFPFRVITRLIGIPVADEAQMLHWAEGLLGGLWRPEEALAARRGFDAYMADVVEDRRRRPRDDFLSYLTTAEFEGHKMEEEALWAFLRQLFPAGAETTYWTAGSTAYAALRDPLVRAEVMKGQRERDLVVSEGLRWESAIAILPRVCTADIEFGGVKMKTGERVLMAIGAANSDPKLHDHPREFVPSRDNRDLVTFGKGIHFCLGAHLARREIEIFLRILFERFPDMDLELSREVRMVGSIIRGPQSLWVRPYGVARSGAATGGHDAATAGLIKGVAH